MKNYYIERANPWISEHDTQKIKLFAIMKGLVQLLTRLLYSDVHRECRKIKECALICFIGPDGSGKSTLAKHLYEEARKRSLSVSYKWWFEGENSFLRKSLRKLCAPIHRAEKTKIEKKKKKRSKLVRIFYPRIVILDYLWFGFKNITIQFIQKKWDMMIFDRFIYDSIVFISEEFEYNDNDRERLLKLCSNLLPKPDLIFIIDVPAEVSYSRKNDIESIESAEKMLAAYKNIYPLLFQLNKGRVVKIDNTGDLDTVKARIIEESGIG